MAIELDAEQRRNMRKAGLTERDAIDFPVSPQWAGHYADQGMTTDYPPDYYRKPDTMTVERIRELEEIAKRLELIKQSGPATHQEVYEVKHLVNTLIYRVNAITKRETGY